MKKICCVMCVCGSICVVCGSVFWVVCNGLLLVFWLVVVCWNDVVLVIW